MSTVAPGAPRAHRHRVPHDLKGQRCVHVLKHLAHQRRQPLHPGATTNTHGVIVVRDRNWVTNRNEVHVRDTRVPLPSRSGQRTGARAST